MTMQTFPLRNQGMDATLRRWVHLLQQAGPNLASGILVLLLAWLLAELTWSLIPRRSTAVVSTAAPTLTAHQIDAEQVADRHLFGAAQAGNAGSAPDTTLAFTLHGIAAGKRASDSRALIEANGDEEPYGVGAQLPGGVTIHAIYADRVLLDRGGRLETLRLPQQDIGGDVVNSGQGLAAQPQAMAPPTQNLGQLRQEIMNNPTRLMQVVRTMPVMDHGKLSGYRIYPAGNPSVFNQLGLKAGDVVTTVNGIPLTDPAQSMRVLSSLKTSDQISVGLIRNGQQQTQILQMPPTSMQDMRQQQEEDNQSQPDNPP
ncbi:MAG TPA: type II secretion system protein GspC [Gammaproteobacteria bacterium]